MNEDIPATDVGGLSRDTAFRLLSHVYRRSLLDCLADHDASLTLTDASEEVTRECRSEAFSNVPEEVFEQVYVALYHSHVPQLVENDVVEYDRDRDVVMLTERGEQLVYVQERLASMGVGGP